MKDTVIFVYDFHVLAKIMRSGQMQADEIWSIMQNNRLFAWWYDINYGLSKERKNAS